MRARHGFAAALLVLAINGTPRATAQGTPPAPGGRPPGRRGGFVPGQRRPPSDPAQVERGKTLYGISCRVCHGADLRGGDMGGPNLLRSQLALSDKDGELIVPVIEAGKGNMPPMKLAPADAKAVATYIRSVLETIGGQGRPPSIGKDAPSIVVGDASEGKAYFAAKCSACHSATGDLQGIASRITDTKALQNAWVSGRRGGGRGFGGPPSERARVTVIVTLPAGEKFDGRLIRIDDFLVTIGLADGSLRTFGRNGDAPKIELRDPLKAHKDLLSVYTDKDMHDVTAYLVTLK